MSEVTTKKNAVVQINESELKGYPGQVVHHLWNSCEGYVYRHLV